METRAVVDSIKARGDAFLREVSSALGRPTSPEQEELVRYIENFKRRLDDVCRSEIVALDNLPVDRSRFRYEIGFSRDEHPRWNAGFPNSGALPSRRFEFDSQMKLSMEYDDRYKQPEANNGDNLFDNEDAIYSVLSGDSNTRAFPVGLQKPDVNIRGLPPFPTTPTLPTSWHPLVAIKGVPEERDGDLHSAKSSPTIRGDGRKNIDSNRTNEDAQVHLKRQIEMRNKFLGLDSTRVTDYSFKSMNAALGNAFLEEDEYTQCVKSINEVMNHQFIERDLYGRVTLHVREGEHPVMRELTRADYDFVFDLDLFRKKTKEILDSGEFVLETSSQVRDSGDSAPRFKVPFMVFDKVFLARKLKNGHVKPGKSYRLIVVPGETSQVWDQPQEKTVILMCTDSLLVLAIEYYVFMSSTTKRFSLKTFVDSFHSWIKEIQLDSITVVLENGGKDAGRSSTKNPKVMKMFTEVGGLDSVSLSADCPRNVDPSLRLPGDRMVHLVGRSAYGALEVDRTMSIFRKNKLDGKVPLLSSVFRLLYYTVAKVANAVLKNAGEHEEQPPASCCMEDRENSSAVAVPEGSESSLSKKRSADQDISTDHHPKKVGRF